MKKNGQIYPQRHASRGAVAVFLCYVLLCVFFMYYVMQNNDRRNSQYLQNASNLRKQAVMQLINSNHQILCGISHAPSLKNLDNTALIQNYLQVVLDGSTFTLIGIANLAGNATLVDQHGELLTADFSSRPFFAQALKGERSMSQSLYEPFLDSHVNYYATPIKRDGDIIGILCGAAFCDTLQETLSFPVYRGQGYFAMVDANGTVMIPGSDPDPAMDVGTPLSHVEESLTSSPLREALAAHQSIQFTVHSVQGAQLLTVEPLEAGDWSLVSTIDVSLMNADFYTLLVGAVALITLACLLFLMLMSLQRRTAIKNQANLERLAYTDSLTGLRSYIKFQVDAREIIDNNPQLQFAVWTFDTKDFSRINRIFGNENGDRILRRISMVLTGPDELSIHCRISSDWFAGIRPYQHKQELEDWFWRVVRVLQQREVIPDDKIRVDHTMGVYFINDFPDNLAVMHMVNNAALAKRQAKLLPSNAILFYTKEMGENQRFLAQLEAGAKEALQNGDIIFFLQPKVAARDDYKITGAEALARWYHPEFGWIGPNDFVPLFENNGFIIDLDRTIFAQVCQWVSQHIAETPEPLRISINVSPRGLFRDDFLSYYTSMKNKYSIPDGILELEFTESVLLDEYSAFHDVVVRLQQNGFICSIDDFGSGYASINVLKSLPINTLKLDANFLRNRSDFHRDQVVLVNFIKMAKQLNMTTVAEGVESADQAEFVQNSGCDMIQGYLFSKPLPCDEFIQLLQANGGRFHLPKE